MFDAELSLLLSEQDESVGRWLLSEGVEHCSDLHYGWSGASYVHFVSGEPIEPDLFNLGRLWAAGS